MTKLMDCQNIRRNNKDHATFISLALLLIELLFTLHLVFQQISINLNPLLKLLVPALPKNDCLLQEAKILLTALKLQ